jgi:hypothetical protein
METDMSPESPRAGSNKIQTVELQDLERKNKELVIQLHDAEDQVASLKVEVERLANGKLELVIKLQDAATEVARLSMVVKHRVSLPDTRR